MLRSPVILDHRLPEPAPATRVECELALVSSNSCGTKYTPYVPHRVGVSFPSKGEKISGIE